MICIVQIMKTETFDMPCYMTESYQNVGIASCINLALGFEAFHQPSGKWPYRALVNAYLKASICSDLELFHWKQLRDAAQSGARRKRQFQKFFYL